MTNYKINSEKLKALIEKSRYTVEEIKERMPLTNGQLAILLDCTPYEFLDEIEEKCSRFEGVVTTYEGKKEYFKSWEWYSEEDPKLTRAQVLKDLKGNGYKVSFLVTSEKMRIIEQLCDEFDEKTSYVVRHYKTFMDMIKELGYTYKVVDGWVEKVKI